MTSAAVAAAASNNVVTGNAVLTQSMRITMDDRLIGWLPGPETDPKVAPLTAGAGQLPTIGRAVLFETMRQGHGPSAVLGGVTAAMQRINASGPALHELGGRLDNTLDVFVAFSVAGGTGNGIFYDYPHLVGGGPGGGGRPGAPADPGCCLGVLAPRWPGAPAHPVGAGPARSRRRPVRHDDRRRRHHPLPEQARRSLPAPTVPWSCRASSTAMWNGWVEVDPPGQDRSPDRIRVRIGHADAPPLVLTLSPFRELSSWASLLQAYEEWVLSDGGSTRRSLAAELIRAVPRNVDRSPEPPSALLTTVCELAGKELQLIEEVRSRPGIGTGEQLNLFEQFWSQTLPAALELPFRGVKAPCANLRDLIEFLDHEGSEPSR